MKKALNSMKWLLLISGILVTIMGVTMFCTPLKNLVRLAVLIGVSMLVSGVSEIASFCGGEKDLRSVWMLASGILSALFGVWTIFGRGSDALATIIPFVFAVWVMSSSIMRIFGAIFMKSKGSGLWGWILAFGISGTVFGFILLFSPLLSAVIISCSVAIMLISYGIDNIIIFFRIKKAGDIIREQLGN